MQTQVNTHGELTFSELRYRRLFETAQDGILILDADTGQIVDVNPFLKELLGYSKKEFLGKKLWQIGIFKDIVKSKTSFRQLQMQGYIRYKDLPLQTKSGRSIDVEFISNVYMVEQQKVIQCNIRDITDRRKAEKLAQSKTEELERLSKEQQETKRAMLNVMEDLAATKELIEMEKAKDEAMLVSIGEGLIAVDNDKRIMIINKAAECMLGWEMKNVVGQKFTTFPLEDAAKKEHFFYVGKDKKRLSLELNVTPITLGKKKIGAIIIFRDSTRERQIDQAKSEFVSLASHQLRTPLGIAKWYIEAIKQECYLDNTTQVAREYLDEVHKCNERLLSIVRDLLSISRIDQGKVRDAPQSIQIIDVIKNVIKNMNILAVKNNIILHLDLKKPVISTIFIDPLRVREIIDNVVANAIMYSKPQGIVEIIVDQKDDTLLIAVKDTGIGISKIDKNRLFTKFFRSEKASVKNAEGSGLGLYVAKSYVEGWGGKISVVSEEGRGSTFTISLPMTVKNHL